MFFALGFLYRLSWVGSMFFRNYDHRTLTGAVLSYRVIDTRGLSFRPNYPDIGQLSVIYHNFVNKASSIIGIF